MARIRTLAVEDVDAEVAHICAEAERQTGSSASARTLANHPGLLKALAEFRAALAGAAVLDAPLKELVRLKIARLNACRY